MIIKKNKKTAGQNMFAAQNIPPPPPEYGILEATHILVVSTIQ